MKKYKLGIASALLLSSLLTFGPIAKAYEEPTYDLKDVEPNDEVSKASPIVQFETKGFSGELSSLDDVDYYTFTNNNSSFAVEFSDATTDAFILDPKLNDQIQFSLYNDKGELIKKSSPLGINVMPDPKDERYIDHLYSGQIDKGTYTLKVESKTVDGVKKYQGPYKLTFKTYYQPKQKPSVLNRKVFQGDVIKGYTEPNVNVSLHYAQKEKYLYDERSHIKTVESDKSGYYEIDLKQTSVKPGNKVVIKTSFDGMPDEPLFWFDRDLRYTDPIFIYDGTAPAFVETQPISASNPYVSGKVNVPNSTIIVLNGKEKIAEGRANANGEFLIKTDFISPKNAGKIVTVYSVSPAPNGIKGETKEIKIQQAKAPTQPSLYPFGNTMTLLSGRTEANAIVSITKDKKVIATVQANKYGWFGTHIPKQKVGTVLSISAKNGAGLVSKATTYTVKDLEIPIVYTNTKVTAKAINGKVSKPYATVQVFENGKVKHTVKANKYGWFDVYYPAKKKGTTLVIKVKDSSGNISKDYSFKI